MPSGSRPPTPPRVCRIAVNGNYSGRPFTNVYHVETDSPGISTSDGVADMLDAFHSALVSGGYLTHLSSAVHVTQLQGVVQLDADTGVEAQLVASDNGSLSGAAGPANVAVCVSWLSKAYWRGGKPRTYLPGVPDADVDTTYSLLDSYKTALASDYSDVLEAVNGITTPAADSVTMGFVSYATGKEWRDPPLFIAYDSCIVHDRLASQRRRLGPWLP